MTRPEKPGLGRRCGSGVDPRPGRARRSVVGGSRSSPRPDPPTPMSSRSRGEAHLRLRADRRESACRPWPAGTDLAGTAPGRDHPQRPAAAAGFAGPAGLAAAAGGRGRRPGMWSDLRCGRGAEVAQRPARPAVIGHRYVGKCGGILAETVAPPERPPAVVMASASTSRRVGELPRPTDPLAYPATSLTLAGPLWIGEHWPSRHSVA